MKRLFMLLCAVVAFVACEQAPIKEMQGAAINERSLEVSFEGGDDTRIQLQNGKTVWTEGDHVSVFYRSTINEEWQFMGETGDRIGNIVPVDNTLNPPATHNRVVVIYPYNNEYYLNTETYSIEASLPAVQNYLEDSYGTNGNIMVSSGDYKQVSLKSVCGWLKLQLTGDGEVVKSITLRGNNGEQVAGELYINTSDATCVLASASGDAGESEVGGTLVRPGTILTEVTLDCGEGVTLGKEAAAFYIALPPQTFEQGFNIEIVCADGSKMVKSSDKALSIERNHIQPMAELSYTANISPSNQIWYTSFDGNIVEPYYTNVFGANIISNEYNNGKGIITFDGDVTTIGNCAFEDCRGLTSVNIPDSVTTIGNNAFYYCTSLTSVTIGDSVTTIGEGAFSDCGSLAEFKGKFAEDNGRILVVDGTLVAFAPAAGITDYTIPDSVTTIGNNAFYECYSLTSVNIPDSVTSIGEWAFGECDSLTSVTIGDSVTTIGEGAFERCTSLTSVTIGDSLTQIGEAAFCYCESLTSVTIPDSVTSIGGWAFGECDSLTSVTIGDSVTTIGEGAFERCTSLTSVTIGDSVTTIGDSAFAFCVSLTSVNIPNSVTSIEYAAFRSCSSLTSVTIPDSVTSIGNYAFYHCTSLTSVYCYATIPPSLDGSAFSGNASGRRIYVYDECVELYKSAWSSYKDSIYANGQNCPDTTTIEYTTNDGNIVTPKNMLVVSNIYDNGVGTLVVVGKIPKIPNDAFRDCTSLTSVNIPNSVTSIGYRAFESCRGLTSVNIPDNVTMIGSYAYYECTSLTSVNIPDSVTTIGGYAFQNCTSLTSVTIGDSVTTIGWSAFERCTSLTSVTIGDSVTTIGDWAFYDCTNLTEFKGKFAEDNGRILVMDGVLTEFAPAGITEYTIPDSVITIGSSAFRDCDSLKSVTIPDSVTTIGNCAFESCRSLTSVNIPDSVTTIGSYAFYECTSLTSVNIPDSVTTIGSYAFFGCTSLTSVNIPDSVTTIGDAAFLNCTSLTEFKGKYATEDGRSLIMDNTIIAYANASGTTYTIPDSVIMIGLGAFFNCPSLTSVNIPDSVTTIGEDAFNSCDSLTSVNIPDSVTTIGNGAFDGCTSLTSVNIPDSVTTIRTGAFYDCTSLTSVYCKATTPPALGSYVFNINGSGRKIYVPIESVEAYRSADGWSVYASAIVGYDFENGVVVE